MQLQNIFNHQPLLDQLDRNFNRQFEALTKKIYSNNQDRLIQLKAGRSCPSANSQGFSSTPFQQSMSPQGTTAVPPLMCLLIVVILSRVKRLQKKMSKPLHAQTGPDCETKFSRFKSEDLKRGAISGPN